MHYLLLKLKSISLAGAFHENHDMPRSLNRLVKNPADRNGKAAKLLGSLLMFLKSTPYIYDSEEIICINNMSGEEHEVSIDDTYEVLLSNADVNYKDHKCQLSAWQTIILKK